MSIKKEDRGRTITGRQICRIISQREQIPFDDVQSVFNCFYEIVEMAMSQNYLISIPSSLGKILLKKNNCIKSGTVKKIPKFMAESIKNDKNKEITKRDGTYYVKYLKDTEQTYTPYVKLSKVLKDRIKEESKLWQK